jgi:hypothetical protein
MREEDLDGYYDGYGSCPLMVIYMHIHEYLGSYGF